MSINYNIYNDNLSFTLATHWTFIFSGVVKFLDKGKSMSSMIVFLQNIELNVDDWNMDP